MSANAVRVRVTKRGRDGEPIYWGVFHNGRLAMQVVRTRSEAVHMAKRYRESIRARG